MQEIMYFTRVSLSRFICERINISRRGASVLDTVSTLVSCEPVPDPPKMQLGGSGSDPHIY